jgi:hypothetical protein
MVDKEASIAKKVEADLTAQTVPVVEKSLKEKWLQIRSVMGTYGEPKVDLPADAKDEDISRYAKEFMTDRQANITLGDGTKKIVSLTDIDAAISRFNTKDSGPVDYPPISDEIPSQKTLRKTAEATERGAESQSGFGSMIMNFLAGLMAWISGLFKTYPEGQRAPTFWEAVSNSAEPKVGHAISQELNQAASNDPNMARFLRQQVDGKSVSDTIVSEAIRETRGEVTGVAQPEKQNKPAIALSDVKMQESGLPSNDSIRTQVYEGIITGSNIQATAFEELKKAREKAIGKDAEADKKTGFFSFQGVYDSAQSYVKSKFAPTDAELAENAKSATELVASTIADAVADPKQNARLKALSKEEFAKEMSDRIITRAEKEHQELGFAKEIFVADPKTKKRPIDELCPALETAIAEQHYKLEQGMDVVKMNRENKLAAANRSEPANKPIEAMPHNGHTPPPTPGMPSGEQLTSR